MSSFRMDLRGTVRFTPMKTLNNAFQCPDLYSTGTLRLLSSPLRFSGGVWDQAELVWWDWDLHRRQYRQCVSCNIVWIMTKKMRLSESKSSLLYEYGKHFANTLSKNWNEYQYQPIEIDFICIDLGLEIIQIPLLPRCLIHAEWKRLY